VVCLHPGPHSSCTLVLHGVRVEVALTAMAFFFCTFSSASALLMSWAAAHILLFIAVHSFNSVALLQWLVSHQLP